LRSEYCIGKTQSRRVDSLVYSNLKLNEISSRPDTELLIKAIYEKNIGCLAQNMTNVLETVTIKSMEL